MTRRIFGSSWRTRLPVLASLAVLAACASSGRSPMVSREAGDGDDVTIVADNQNYLDATVYAVWNGTARQRLGMVTGKTSQTFQVNGRSGELALEVDFVGGGSVTTEPIGVFEGDHLEIVIPPA